MTTYSAVENWTVGQIRLPARGVQLTRRGRLIRTLVILVAIAGLATMALGKLSGEPARAAVGTDLVVPTRTVTVQQGDSLWRIARQVAPARDPREVILELREINGLSNGALQPGQVLLVSAGE